MPSILLVDDHPSFLSFLENGLIRRGYRPIIATSGAEALRRIEVDRPDVAVIDVMMPEMDGIELLRELRARYPALPVIAMTGAGEGLLNPVTSLMYVLGAQAVLAKPFAAATLIEIIDRWSLCRA